MEEKEGEEEGERPAQLWKKETTKLELALLIK